MLPSSRSVVLICHSLVYMLLVLLALLQRNNSTARLPSTLPQLGVSDDLLGATQHYVQPPDRQSYCPFYSCRASNSCVTKANFSCQKRRPSRFLG